VVRILSVSYCVPVKRIDRILDGVVEFARKQPDVRVEWAHIGDGPLRQLMIQRATERAAGIPSLRITFDGELENQEVRRRMAEESWDVLINASESEGVPVSIMEAMSFGIPAIATDVGGVSEIVNARSRLLMASDADGNVIASLLLREIETLKGIAFRERCKGKIRSEFNAELNYRAFVRACIEVMK
jgi:glycosyltransferase involved in cell wall biosynthesis